MEKTRVLHKKRRWILVVLLLAAFCLGAAELVACRIADPVLYEQVTAPARACARQAAEAGRAAALAAARAGKAAGAAAAEAGRAAVQAVSETAARAGEAVADAIAPVNVAIPEKAVLLKEVDESQRMGPSLLPARQGIVDESVSRLEARDDLEYLTGGGIDVVYYNQVDEQWASKPYGSDPLGGYGCGPTAMSIVVSSLLGADSDPASMALECVNAGYWCKSSGSYLSIVPGIAASYGLECRSIPPEALDEDDLLTHLATGDLAVALMTRGHFTSSGHFIVLRGLTLEGQVLVADPASRERSLTPWDLSLIVSELSPSRHDGAPLWLISRPAGM